MHRQSLLHRFGLAAVLVALLTPAGLCLCGEAAAEAPQPCHGSRPETEVAAACCCASEVSEGTPESTVPKPMARPVAPPAASEVVATLAPSPAASRRRVPCDLRPPEAPPPAFSIPLRN